MIDAVAFEYARSNLCGRIVLLCKYSLSGSGNCSEGNFVISNGRYSVNGPGVANYLVLPDKVHDVLFMCESIYYAGKIDKLDEINKALTLVKPSEYK